MSHGRGYKRDPVGHRVTPIGFHPLIRATNISLPKSARVATAPVMDQVLTSECVPHAIMAALFPVLGFVGSQTVLYGLANDLGRADDGIPFDAARVDQGVAPNEAVRAVQTFGVIPRASSADYDARNSDADPATATRDVDLAQLEGAATCLVMGQYEVHTPEDIMTALAVVKRGVTVAMTATDAVENWDPSSGPIAVQDGPPNHYVEIVGYNIDATDALTWEVQNSWGLGWGLSGFFTATELWARTLQDMYVWDASIRSRSTR